jgi:hypothetical protein
MLCCVHIHHHSNASIVYSLGLAFVCVNGQLNILYCLCKSYCVFICPFNYPNPFVYLDEIVLVHPLAFVFVPSVIQRH